MAPKIVVRAALLCVALIIILASPALAVGIAIGKFGDEVFDWLNEPDMPMMSEKKQ